MSIPTINKKEPIARLFIKAKCKPIKSCERRDPPHPPSRVTQCDGRIPALERHEIGAVEDAVNEQGDEEGRRQIGTGPLLGGDGAFDEGRNQDPPTETHEGVGGDGDHEGPGLRHDVAALDLCDHAVVGGEGGPDVEDVDGEVEGDEEGAEGCGGHGTTDYHY